MRTIFAVLAFVLAVALLAGSPSPAAAQMIIYENCNCTENCTGTNNKLTSDSEFMVNIRTSYFNRFTFLNRIAPYLTVGRFDIIDKKITNDSYIFGFTPRALMTMTSARVCYLDNIRNLLFNLHACCLRGVNRTTDEPVVTAGESNTQSSHQTKLIVAWVILALAGGYTLIIQRRESKGKDWAVDSAEKLATELDPDEEEEVKE